MPTFHYTALDAQGHSQKGVLEADNARHARQLLRAQGLLPSQLHESTKPKKNASARPFWQRLFQTRAHRLKNAELALISRQLATLIAARIPLDEALSGVADQTEKNAVKSILLGVRAKVLEGHKLATAMAEFPEAFPLLYRETIAAGEKSGQLHVVLEKLTDYVERQHRMTQKITQALVYPALMMLVSMAVVGFLLTSVVPKIVGVFAETQMHLPTVTTVLLTGSHWLQVYGLYLLALLLGGFLGFRALLKRSLTFRRRWHAFLLKIPLLGRTYRTINCTRFARTLGILHGAGVPLLEAMQAASQLLDPIPMREALQTSIQRVREGGSIHHALQQTHYFPPLFIHLIASGEASGQLQHLLEKAAEYQENDIATWIENVLTLFEPIMILIMGGVVLFIVLAVMLPIFTLDQFGG